MVIDEGTRRLSYIHRYLPWYIDEPEMLYYHRGQEYEFSYHYQRKLTSRIALKEKPIIRYYWNTQQTADPHMHRCICDANDGEASWTRSLFMVRHPRQKGMR